MGLTGHDKEGNEIWFDKDEGIREGTTAEKLAGLDSLIQMGMLKPVEVRGLEERYSRS